MITLKPVDESNFEECIHLKVNPEQSHFVASNVYSLAEAYLHRDAWHPLAVYDGDTMIGFMMHGEEADTGRHWIIRVMVDARYQRRGCGKAMLQTLIGTLTQTYGCEEILLSTENPIAEKLYAQLGFVRTGEMAGDEYVMKLKP